MFYAILFQVQKFLMLQPDVKVLNGLFWTERWLWVAQHPTEALETVSQVIHSLV